MLKDLRFAFRQIARERWFSATAIVALALGIGVNATGFTLLNAAFFRGLPFDGADRLYMLSWQPRAGTRSNVSYPDFEQWRAENRSFDGLAAFSNTTMNLSDGRALPEQTRGTWVTANVFGVLRQPPLLGRDFAPGDDRKGAELVAVISYRVWQNRYGGDPGVLGMPVRVNGEPATIVGVMPDRMNFPNNTEVWAPFIPTETQQQRNARPLSVFGRLHEEASLETARAEVNGLALRLAAAYPETNKDVIGARIETFTERYVGGNARDMFLVVMGAVCFVLLIACANVANLLLSRSADRTREMAVRVALGATRSRVIRQLLVESLVLGVIGGSIGVLLAAAGVRVFDAAVQDPGKPYWIVFTLDYVVLGYVAAICVLTAMLSGLAPALGVSKTNTHAVLKEGGRGSAGSRRARWFSGAMVVTELALTVVLLAGAGLMLRSFMKLYAVDIGISPERLTAMRLQLPQAKYPTPELRRAFFDRLEPRLAALPGIESVAVTTGVPPGGGGMRTLEIDGRPKQDGQSPDAVAAVIVSPRFFETVRVSAVRGRAFHDGDGAPGSETALINERLAAQRFAGEDPVGQRLRFTARQPAPPGEPVNVWRTIVGVVPSIRHGGSQDADLIAAAVYIPYRQEPPAAASLLVRSGLPPGSIMEAVRREVQAVDQDQPVFTIQTLEQLMADNRWPYRVFGGMFAIFAVIALVLSSVGLYAVMAYSVTQRTREIGVRMAVGAERGQVSWMILKRGLIQLSIGLTIGLAGALALSRVLRPIVVEITPSDPVTFAAVTTLLTGVSIAACLLPARRAMRVDPLIALRAE